MGKPAGSATAVGCISGSHSGDVAGHILPTPQWGSAHGHAGASRGTPPKGGEVRPGACRGPLRAPLPACLALPRCIRERIRAQGAITTRHCHCCYSVALLCTGPPFRRSCSPSPSAPRLHQAAHNTSSPAAATESTAAAAHPAPPFPPPPPSCRDPASILPEVPNTKGYFSSSWALPEAEANWGLPEYSTHTCTGEKFEDNWAA